MNRLIEEHGSSAAVIAPFQDNAPHDVPNLLSFSEILHDWEVSHGGALDAFLHDTHLDICLSENQWQRLTSGEEIPSVTLANHLLAVLLQDRAYIADKPYLLDNANFPDLHEAVRLNIQKAQRPIIDVPNDKLAALRLAIAQDKYSEIIACATSAVPSRPYPSLPKDAFSQKLLVSLKDARPHADLREVLCSLKALLTTQPERVTESVQEIMADENRTDIEKWQTSVLAHTQLFHPGQLFSFFRHCKGLSRVDMAKSLQWSSAKLRILEHGEYNVTSDVSRKAQKSLSLLPDEMRLVTQACFPALDMEWLEKQQPRSRQPGLLCSALRGAFNWRLEDLAKQSRISKERLCDMVERGEVVEARTVEKLIKAFEHVKPTLERPCHWLEEKRIVKLRQMSGGVSPLRALDPEWLKTQHPKRRAALLVIAARIKMGWTSREMADHMGFSQQVQSDYETGSRPIAVQTMERYIAVLTAENEAASLVDQWFDSKMAASMRQVALDYQCGAIPAPEPLATCIRKTREALGHTKESLGKVIDVSSKSIAAAERGNSLRRDTIRRIANGLEAISGGKLDMRPLREACEPVCIEFRRPMDKNGHVLLPRRRPADFRAQLDRENAEHKANGWARS